MATGVSQFWGDLAPETQAALISAGFGALGGIGKAKADEAKTKFQTGGELLGGANTNALNARKTGLELQQGDFKDRTGQVRDDFVKKSSDVDAADRLVLGAMGSTPNQFNNERAGMQARAEILSKAQVPNYLKAQVPSWMATGLSPKTISMIAPSAEKEKGYWDAVAMASKGRFKGPSLEGTYGDSGRALDQAIGGTTKESGDYFNKTWDDYTKDRETRWDTYEGGRDKGINDLVGVSDKQRQDAMDLMNGVDKLAAGEKKKGGFWSKLGGIIKVAGPIAAMAIPGIGPAVAMAISAASSTAGTKLQGGSWGSALAAGGLSAAAQGALGGFPGKTPPIMHLTDISKSVPLSAPGWTLPKGTLLPTPIRV